MSQPLQRKVVFGFATAVFVLCVIGIVSIQSIRQLIDDFQINERQRQQILLLEGILSEVKDAETGVRGYCITGDRSYLAPYHAAVASVDSALSELRAMSLGDADAERNVDRLMKLVREKLTWSTSTIEALEAEGFDAVKELMARGDGKRVMDELRALVASMTGETAAVLKARSHSEATNARATMLIIAVGSAAAIALLSTALVMLKRDMRARGRAEQSLKESEERFRQLAQHVNEVFWVTSGDKVIYASPAFESIWGRSCQWLLDNPMSWVETIVPEDRERVRAAFVGIAERGEFDQEYRILRPDGELRWIHARGAPVSDSEGRIYRCVGVAADVTKDKLAEEELERARATAIAANRAKSEFLANMSHEIRTPMTAIVGYIDLMLDPKQEPSDRLNCINVIRRNGDHLLTVINDILDISKIEAGEMQMERIACAPCQILSDVASLMRVRAADKKLRFEVQVEGPIPQTVLTDPTRLRQIVINLVGNAIKFTESGWVRLSMKLEDAPDGPTPRLRFEVTDTGIGIARDNMDRLFQPFAQADTSTTRRFGGTGLGLFISRRLAQMLGGDIQVDSVPGRGSLFSVSVDTGPLAGIKMLPHCSEVMSPVEAPVEPSPLELTGRILLAEDGVDNQQLLSFYLRRAGAEVVVAENGRIACEKAMQAVADGLPFDLILMDMQMPELDGYAATTRLRSKGYNGPIVALTAHAMAHDRDKCIKSGCTDYLSKPITRASLIGMAQRHLSRRVPLTISGTAQEGAARLRPTGIEDDVIRQFIPAFLGQLVEHVCRLQTHVADRDCSQIASVLHMIKGSSGLYGFAPIMELASQAEESALQSASFEAIAQQVGSLIDMIRQVDGYERHQEAFVHQKLAQPGGSQ